MTGVLDGICHALSVNVLFTLPIQRTGLKEALQAGGTDQPDCLELEIEAKHRRVTKKTEIHGVTLRIPRSSILGFRAIVFGVALIIWNQF